MQPLGLPVVPLVYSSMNRDSPLTDGSISSIGLAGPVRALKSVHPARVAPCRIFSSTVSLPSSAASASDAIWLQEKQARAPASSMMNRSSGAACRMFSGTSTAPIHESARKNSV